MFHVPCIASYHDLVQRERETCYSKPPEPRMVSVESGHLKHAATETKFICVSEPVAVGSLIDGWKVGWCMPDQNRIIWHVMVLRSCVELRGCCG